MKIKYRADVDGLRAIAVLVVVFFHANVGIFAGGFIGVDVFFVISGYLITKLILSDLSRDQFSLAEFYERRVRRLFPALSVVVSSSLLAGYLCFFPAELKQLGASAIAAMGFVANIFFSRQTDYFAPATELQPLLHTWSLAVEEQFYLAFPLFLLLTRRLSTPALKIVVAMVAAASFGIGIWGSLNRPIAAFYLAPFRAWELLTGCLVALTASAQIGNRFVRESAAFLGLLMVLCSAFLLTRISVFPGYNALLPVVGTVLLIRSAEAQSTIVSRVLASSPFVAVGLISYPLYLWHWPLFAFARYLQAREVDAAQAAAIVALSIVLAGLVYLVLEKPVRSRKVVKSRFAMLSTAAAGSLAVGILGSVIYLSDGMPARLAPGDREIVAANESTGSEWRYPLSCGANFRKPIARPDDVTYCVLGPSAERTILFWGDSNVEQLFPPLEAVARGRATNGVQIIMATSGGCLPVIEIERVAAGYDCAGFNRQVLARATGGDIARVVVGSVWNIGDDAWKALPLETAGAGAAPAGRGDGSIDALVEERLLVQLEAVANAGKKITLILPFPHFDRSLPQYLARRLIAKLPPEVLLTRDMHRAMNRNALAMLRRVAEAVGADLLDPAELLCGDGSCNYHENSTSLYRDGYHLNPMGSLKLLPMMNSLVERVSSQP